MESAVKLFVCGDFYAKSVEGLSFGADLQSKIDSADISVCNFEGPIKTKDAKPIPKDGPTLYQDPQAPLYLERCGFNVFLCGNNHFMDYGYDGAKQTLASFTTKSTQVGAGTANEAYAVKKVVVKGKTIGFISVVQQEFGVLKYSLDKEDPDSQAIGTAWVCSPELRKIFDNAKKEVDYLLVFPHAGIEHINAPLPEWREIYKRFIDWGADAVIASHPHVPQGWEIYKGHPIYYSLGNFYFDTLKGGQWWFRGMAVELELGEKIVATTVNTKFSNLFIDLDFSNEVLEHNRELNRILHDEEEYQAYIDNISKKAYQNYVYLMVRSVNAITLNVGWQNSMKTIGSMLLNKGNKNFLLNILQCESHRWLLERAIKVEINKSM